MLLSVATMVSIFSGPIMISKRTRKIDNSSSYVHCSRLRASSETRKDLTPLGGPFKRSPPSHQVAYGEDSMRPVQFAARWSCQMNCSCAVFRGNKRPPYQH